MTNEIVGMNKEVKMTSREVAELTGKSHSHVLRDIKDEIQKLKDGKIETQTIFGLSEYEDSTGRKLPMYVLAKDGVLQLAARYDAVTRYKLIEMANKQQTPKVPMNYKEALLALVEAEEEKERLQLETQKQQLQIEEMTPKAQFTDRLLKSKDNLLVREYAKVLQDEGFTLGEKKLYKWLRDNRYLMQNNEPYQKYMKYFKVIERTRDTMWGQKITKTTKVTPQGQLYFYEKLEKEFTN
jgi:anti-repressor protein